MRSLLALSIIHRVYAVGSMIAKKLPAGWQGSVIYGFIHKGFHDLCMQCAYLLLHEC